MSVYFHLFSQKISIHLLYCIIAISSLTLFGCKQEDKGFPVEETFSPPTTSQLLISPKSQVNTISTASYQFNDSAERLEGNSKINWYLDNKLHSSDALFTPTNQHEGKWLYFCVIPVAAYGNNFTGVQNCTAAEVILTAAGSAPEAKNVLISTPLQPGNTAQGSYLYLDDDNDLEGDSLLVWKLDGVIVSQGTNYTLPTDSEGAQLSFCVTPVALTGEPKIGVEACDIKTINGIYIAPIATNLLITPSPVANTLITGTYLFSDANNRPEGASMLSWKLNGVNIVSETSSTITLAASDEGKNISFCVIPIASYGENSTGSKVCTTPTIVIAKNGSAPKAVNLTLSSPLQPGQAVTANYLYVDNDGDNEGASIPQWFVDSLDIGSGLNATLPINSEGKMLTFCITPIALTGMPKQGLRVCLSKPIIGVYTPPMATHLLITPTPIVGSVLTGTYLFSDANNRIEGNSELSWKIDGIDTTTGSAITLTKNDEGKDLTFCVIPIAINGQNSTGVQICTSPVNINPQVGSAPSATNLSWDTFVKPSTFLTVSYDFNDPDGDAEGVSLFSWKLDNIEVSQNISYTPPADSGGKSVEFCISPVALTGTPKMGIEKCITTDIAAILLSGELQFDQTLTLEIKGYTNLGVIWRSTNPSSNNTRSTSSTSFTITRATPTESAFAFLGYDIEVCVDTTEEGQLCSLASSYDVSKVTGGLPMVIDAGFDITQRGVAPIPYVDLTIGLITKRLHRPLTTIETQILNNTQPAVPLFDNQRAENGTTVFWGLFTWPHANTQCNERGYSLTVDGINDTSDLFGLKQFYDEIIGLYPDFAVSHVSSALGWGSNVDYYWSISDVGGGSHADVYMVSGSLGQISDTTPEYAACIEILP